MDAGDTDPRSGPLRVVSAARRTFGGFSDLAFDPRLRLFLADLVRPFDLPLRDDLLDNGAGHSYGEMAAEVIRETVPADSPVDLLIMAFGIHDIRLGRATASYLSAVCPGDAMGFAVCDQGTAAAFTALRLIGEYGRSGVCERAVLVVVEQSALHYQQASPAPVPERHSAVAVLFERGVGGNHTVVRQHADVSPQLAGALLADDVAALSAGRADVTLVLGGGLTQFGHTYLADRVVLAPAGQPYTGPWWELAGGLPRWRRDGRLVLLAEYDQTLGYLALSAVDFAPSAMTKPLAVTLAVPGKQWTS
jgi:4-hydroxymandelate oxidase